MFSSKSFIVSSPTFKFLTHFECVFVYGVRESSNFFFFFFLHLVVQFPQHYLLKRVSFPIVYSCLFCHRRIDYCCMGLFLGFLSSSVDLYFSFACVCACVHALVLYCFDYFSFEIREPDTSSFTFLSQDCFCYSGSSVFYTH